MSTKKEEKSPTSINPKDISRRVLLEEKEKAEARKKLKTPSSREKFKSFFGNKT
jgi:hypothetical protein